MRKVTIRYVLRKDGRYLRCRSPLSWGSIEETPLFFEETAIYLAKEYQADVVIASVTVQEPPKEEGNEK